MRPLTSYITFLRWELRDLREDAVPIGTVHKWKRGDVVKTAKGWEPVAKRASTTTPSSPAPQPKPAAKPVPKAGTDKPAAASPPKAAPVAKEVVASIEQAIASGALPKGMTAEQHVKEAEDFLGKHARTLDDSLARMKKLAPAGAVVMGRVKAVESALGKLVRKPKYGRASNLQDGTGMRIVAKTLDDVRSTIDKIRKNYDVISEDDYITKPKDGYRSYHCTIRDSDGLAKEVQVRTPNMDTWANWAHDTVYKPHDPEQERAVQANRDKIDAYAAETSRYLAARDEGKETPKPPCPPIFAQISLPCL